MSDIKEGLKKLIESKITRDFEGYPVGISDIGLADQIISYLKSQICGTVNPYKDDPEAPDSTLHPYMAVYEECRKDILSKLQ